MNQCVRQDPRVYDYKCIYLYTLTKNNCDTQKMMVLENVSPFKYGYIQSLYVKSRGVYLYNGWLPLPNCHDIRVTSREV